MQYIGKHTVLRYVFSSISAFIRLDCLGETTMILLLTTMVAMAKTDTLVTHLESRSYRQNGKLLVVSTDKVLLSRLENTTIPHETLPKLGNIEKEIGRLQNKYGTTCVINLAPQSEGEEGPVQGVTLIELGDCAMDENIRYSIKDNGKLWSVVDHEGDEVSVQTFANVCEDIPLLLRLEHEENIARRNGEILEWGATGLAVAGLFTMGNPDPGFSAREQNRFWTSVFLFGTAAIFYTQRDMPFVYMTDTQSDLANYHSRDSVERILLKTFGLPTEETLQESNTAEDTKTVEDGTQVSDDTSNTESEPQTSESENEKSDTAQEAVSVKASSEVVQEDPTSPTENQPETEPDASPVEGEQ